jgi:VCBS repeat-containing protein
VVSDSITLIAKAFSVFTNMVFGSGPGGTADSPAMWVLAAAARRQFDPSAGEQAGAAATTDSVTTSEPMMTMAAATTLEATNSPPTATLTKQSAPSTYSGTVTGKVTASDPDGDKVTFVTPVTTAKGTVTMTSTGSFTYKPTAAARHAAAAATASAADETDTFDITVTDGRGGVTNVPVTVTITPANSAPTTTSTVNKPDPVSGAATGSITVTDKDGDAPTFTATTPTNGSVVVHPDGTFTYTPTDAARATARTTSTTDTDKFTITVDDGHGGTKAVAVTVNIAPSDTAPVNGTFTTGAPTASTGVVKGAVTATDNEDDTLTYARLTKPAKGSVTVYSNGKFTYTPTSAARHAAAADDATTADTTDTFTVTVKDKYGATTTVPVTVNILPKDAVPTSGKATVGQPASSRNSARPAPDTHAPRGVDPRSLPNTRQLH